MHATADDDNHASTRTPVWKMERTNRDKEAWRKDRQERREWRRGDGFWETLRICAERHATRSSGRAGCRVLLKSTWWGSFDEDHNRSLMPSVDSRLSLRLELAEIPLIKSIQRFGRGWLVWGHNRWTGVAASQGPILPTEEKIGRDGKEESLVSRLRVLPTRDKNQLSANQFELGGGIDCPNIRIRITRWNRLINRTSDLWSKVDREEPTVEEEDSNDRKESAGSQGSYDYLEAIYVGGHGAIRRSIRPVPFTGRSPWSRVGVARGAGRGGGRRVRVAC